MCIRDRVVIEDRRVFSGTVAAEATTFWCIADHKISWSQFAGLVLDEFAVLVSIEDWVRVTRSQAQRS